MFGAVSVSGGEADPNFFNRPCEWAVGSQRCGSVFIRARASPGSALRVLIAPSGSAARTQAPPLGRGRVVSQQAGTSGPWRVLLADG